MKRFPKIFLDVLASLFCACAFCYYGYYAQARSVEGDALSDFQWFSNLGFPDVKGCPFVRVATGQWSQSGDEPPQNHYLKGFLLATNGNVFTVLSLNLSQAQFANSTASIPEHKRVGFEVLRLDAEAEALRRALQKPPGKDDVWRRFGEQTTERVDVFTLSDRSLTNVAERVARAVKIGSWKGNRPPTFNSQGDKALVQCEFRSGRDLLVYTATFHKVGEAWTLRGIRETMQALLAKDADSDESRKK